MLNSIFLELSSEVCTCELATVVTPDVLQSFWSEGLIVQVLSKVAFDVCSSLLVDVWSFTFVFHEVHPREAVKTVCTVWVAATSDEVHSTQGLLEAQGDSQRLGNREWGKTQSLLK